MAGKLQKHVKKQIKESPILAGHEAEYAKWNAKLEAEGLRALTNDYRAVSEHENRRRSKQGPNAELARFEYYDGLRDYCRYNHFQLDCMRTMRQREQEQFKQMLTLFVEGLSMDDCYSIVKQNYKTLYTKIYFFKRFQEAKAEFLSNFSRFNDYMAYRKYELSEPLSFEAWLTRENLSEQ